MMLWLFLMSLIVWTATVLSEGMNCCDAINAKLPSIVHLPTSSEYRSRHSTYYSLQQQELYPDCTVKPRSAQDVSEALKIAHARQCHFAVASGGHMCWKGSSNLDEGFVFDLRGLNQIDISTSDETVKLGPGSTWESVYKKMAPLNVTTSGGRINAVGVGGFLLGGGIAFDSVEKGFAGNNVFNYEAVLSNGTIVNVNKDTHADLFWALKLAGSNFGIVTRFDMRTYSSPAIWGGLTVWPITNKTTTELLANFERYGHDNKNTKDFKSVVLVQNGGQELAMSVQANLDAIPLAAPASEPPVQHLEKIGTTYDVVNEVIAGALESSARASWFTLTTKIDMNFYSEIYKKGSEMFKPLQNRQGLSWFVGIQALQKSFIEQTANSPVYNILKQSNDDLVFILILVTWKDLADDLTMKQTTNALGSWAEAEGRKRGVLNDFVYLNYANGEQQVYERSVSVQDLIRLQQVRKAYDPDSIFEKLWKGGYKLPKSQQSSDSRFEELLNKREL